MRERVDSAAAIPDARAAMRDGGARVLLCVTADDFGLAPSVDAAILRLAQAGRVDAVSVMACSDAALERARALAATGVAVGLHLVLSDREGALSRQRRPVLGALGVARAGRRAIRAAIEGQLERHLAAGLRLDFVNGHQHLHALPPVWRELGRAIEERGVPAVRWVRGVRGSWSRALVGASCAVSEALRPVRVRTVLSPIAIGGGPPTLAEIDAALGRARPAPGVVHELVVHPGDPDPAGLPGPIAWGDRRRARERDLLASDALEELLRRRARRVRPGIDSTHAPG